MEKYLHPALVTLAVIAIVWRVDSLRQIVTGQA